MGCGKVWTPGLYGQNRSELADPLLPEVTGAGRNHGSFSYEYVSTDGLAVSAISCRADLPEYFA